MLLTEIRDHLLKKITTGKNKYSLDLSLFIATDVMRYGFDFTDQINKLICVWWEIVE
jgi:hypothetical protein